MNRTLLALLLVLVLVGSSLAASVQSKVKLAETPSDDVDVEEDDSVADATVTDAAPASADTPTATEQEVDEPEDEHDSAEDEAVAAAAEAEQQRKAKDAVVKANAAKKPSAQSFKTKSEIDSDRAARHPMVTKDGKKQCTKMNEHNRCYHWGPATQAVKPTVAPTVDPVALAKAKKAKANAQSKADDARNANAASLSKGAAAAKAVSDATTAAEKKAAQAKLAQAKLEHDRAVAKLNKAKADQAKADKILNQEKIAKEKQAAAAKAAAAQVAAVKAAAEKAAAAKAASAKAAAAQAAAAMAAAAKVAAHKAAAAAKEKERVAKEKAAVAKDKERVTQSKAITAKAAADKAEKERVAASKAAANKAEKERLAKEEATKAEQRLAHQKAVAAKEKERVAKEKEAAAKEKERVTKANAAAAKAAADKAEKARVAASKAAADKAEKERVAAAKAAATKAAAEKAAAEAKQKAAAAKPKAPSAAKPKAPSAAKPKAPSAAKPKAPSAAKPSDLTKPSPVPKVNNMSQAKAALKAQQSAIDKLKAKLNEIQAAEAKSPSICNLAVPEVTLPKVDLKSAADIKLQIAQMQLQLQFQANAMATEFKAEVKAAITGGAKMALNLAKDKAREALIKLSATLKAKFMSLAESPEMMDLLTKCANGQGPLAVLQFGCKYLLNGMSGTSDLDKKAFVSGITFPELGYPAIAGTIDVSAWFGVNAPIMQFQLAMKDRSVSFMLAFEDGFELTFASMLQNLLPSGMGTSDLIAKFRMDSLSLTIGSIVVNVNPFAFKIGGMVKLWAVTVPFNILIGNLGGAGWDAGMTFQIPGENIEYLKDCLGPIAPVFNMFKVESFDLTITTGALKLDKLVDMQWNPTVTRVTRGMSFYLAASLNIEYSSFTKFLAKFLPPTFVIPANFDGKRLALSFDVPAIDISNKIQAGFNVQVQASLYPMSMTLALEGYLKVKVQSDTLKFWAKAFVNLPNPTLGLSIGMEGMWCGAFNINPLCIGDITGEIAMMAVTPWIASIALGGTLQLGNPALGQNDPITGKAYFKIDIANPVNNYVYAHVNKFTIGQFLNIIAGMDLSKIPSLIAQTGFDKGVLFSYSMTPVTLPSGDEIPIGFRIKGGLNFFGWKCFGEVLVAPSKLLFHFQMDRLSFGPFKFTRSVSNQAEGPLVHLMASLEPPMQFEAKIKAYLDMFIFKAMVDIEINSKRFSIFVKTPIFFLFMATVNITATYDGITTFNACTMARMTFYFYARIDTTEITRDITSAIRAFEKAAVGKLQEAQRALDRAEVEAVAKINSVCDDSKCRFQCNGKTALELAAQTLGHSHVLVASHTEESLELDASDADYDQLLLETAAALKSREHVFLQLEAEAQAASKAELQAMCQWWDAGCHANRAREALEWAANEARRVAEEGARRAREAAERAAAEVRRAAEEARRHAEWAAAEARKVAEETARKARQAAERAAAEVKRVAKETARKAAAAALAAKNWAADQACTVARVACRTGCAGLKAAAIGATKLVLGAAKGAVSLSMAVIQGLASIIPAMLNSMALDMSIETKLDKENFDLGCSFYFKAGSFQTRFAFKFNFRIAKIMDFVNMLFNKVKDFIKSKVPGVSALGI